MHDKGLNNNESYIKFEINMKRAVSNGKFPSMFGWKETTPKYLVDLFNKSANMTCKIQIITRPHVTAQLFHNKFKSLSLPSSLASSLVLPLSHHILSPFSSSLEESLLRKLFSRSFVSLHCYLFFVYLFWDIHIHIWICV